MSFKRYLDIAKKFKNKNVAIITDNDKDYSTNIVERYSEYKGFGNIKVFSDSDDDNYTFEVCVYNNNQTLIDNANLTRSNDILRFMLNEKAEFALRLLEKLELSDDLQDFNVPNYITEAIHWVLNN